MVEYDIFSDSACDLPFDIVKKGSINILPFTFSFDKVNKLKDGIDITNDEFYRQLQLSGSVPKTYPPTVRNYVDAFKRSLEQGRDIICICLSSKLSKSYFNALNAKKILSHTHKQNKIMVIDSLSASGGQGLVVLDAVKLRGSYDVEAAFRMIEEIKKSIISILTVSSLEQLAKGGRISGASARLGQLLRLNPIIYLEKGALVSKSKVMGRQNALDEIKKLTVKEMGNPSKYDFCMLHSRALDEAIEVGRSLELSDGIKQTLAPIELGVTIGMHTGATVAATMFVKKI